MATSNCRHTFADEIARVAREVGTERWLGG
jgi:hypothetical protein